jgi:hypothetical protein
MVLLNAMSGVLIMMATSIGAYDTGFANIDADFHDYLDPRLTQWKIDCLRIHAVHWLRYSSGWQAIENLGRHAYNIHLWVLPAEFVCAMFAFQATVLLYGQNRRLDVALVVASLAYCNFPTYWPGWAIFASLFIAHLHAPKPESASVLPLVEYKGRKVSQPVRIRFRGDRAAYLSTAGLGLYLLSANFFGFGMPD